MCRARSAREYPGDAEQFEWVTQFLRLGFIILSGLPAEEGAILKLSAYYRARRAFDHMLRAAEFEIRFLLGARRASHDGQLSAAARRTGFDPREGLRYLQGCYIDIDAPRSLYRVLRRKCPP